MTHGHKVAGGDRLGKTIIFAKNQAHAEFIAERFDANYPHYTGEFARVITFKTEYAQTLIDDFSTSRQGAAHRDLGRHARHRHRRARGREPGVLQAGALEDQVLADDRPRHPPVPGPVRARARTRSSSTSSTTARTSSSSARTRRRRRALSAESLAKRLFTARLELIGELDEHPEPPRPARRRDAGTSRRTSSGPAPGRGGGDEPRQLHRPPAAPLVERYAQAEPWKNARRRRVVCRKSRGCPRRWDDGRRGEAVRPD